MSLLCKAFFDKIKKNEKCAESLIPGTEREYTQLQTEVLISHMAKPKVLLQTHSLDIYDYKLLLLVLAKGVFHIVLQRIKNNCSPTSSLWILHHVKQRTSVFILWSVKMLGSVQITHQRLSQLEVIDFCQSLQASTIKLLSLRECEISDSGYDELMHSLTKCKSILQLNLNLGVVNSAQRAQALAGALHKNRSLTSLFIHGSHVGKQGFEVLCKALALHPNIVSLDVGECGINDKSMDWIITLLQPNGAKRGLQDLTLSHNADVTVSGWVKFFIALASSNCLKTLCLDYNAINDEGLRLLCVALASCRQLETLDLEGTGITSEGAMVLLHLLKNYPVSLTEIVLDENPIKKPIKDAVWKTLKGQSVDLSVEVTSMSSTSETDTDTETGDSQSQSLSAEQFKSVSGQSEYDTQSSYSETSTIKFPTKTPKPPRKLSPHFMASATLRAQEMETNSDRSVDSEGTESGAEVEGRFSWPRPSQGYFSRALQSTGSGVDSPLHTVNSMQYAYSDISAS